jgi:DNA-binding transcriptional LysR family regulator
VDLIAALRTFLRVAEVGSFSAVAEERGVTQPAVSRQVSALESILLPAWSNAARMPSP